MKIRTNNVPRHAILGFDLSPEERAEFDYLSEEELGERSFARYKGQLYDLGDFITTTPGPWNMGLPPGFLKWDGYADESAFFGTLIRYTDDFESVVFGQYFT